MDLWIIFLTGLTTGGLACLAMQGGLLASVIANQKELEIDNESIKKGFSKDDWLPVTMFLLVKLISHTLLGALLGALGSVISLSLGLKITFQVLTALFMFATAMNLLDVHPIFRFVVIQPPKFIQRKIRTSTSNTSWFAPGLLGALTVFVPCGVTQAMEVLAINSGSPLQGALIMFAFVLGTSPLFGILGIATSRFSEKLQQKFLHVAAYALIAMSLYAINGVLVVMDAPISVQRIISMYQTIENIESGSALGSTTTQIDGLQKVTIDVLQTSYSPNYVKVQSGVPVELTLKSNGVYSCASAFVFREFGISTMLKPTDTQTFTFTPKKPGRYTFACSMGMYTGTMEVI